MGKIADFPRDIKRLEKSGRNGGIHLQYTYLHSSVTFTIQVHNNLTNLLHPIYHIHLSSGPRRKKPFKQQGLQINPPPTKGTIISIQLKPTDTR